MAQFVLIGVLVVDLEQCAFEAVAGPAICVYTQGRTFGPYSANSDMYRILEAWMSQQKPMEKLLVEQHECHICGFADTLRCEGCRKWACGGHSLHVSMNGEIQRLCDECRGFIRDTTRATE